MKIQIGLALAFLVIAPAAATAQTQEDQQACMNDAFGVCGAHIPDRDRVAACLAQNINRISPACRAVILRGQTPAAAAPVTSKAPINIKPKNAVRIRASKSSCKKGAPCGRKVAREKPKQPAP
jgi:hypothetical protein